jgi:hypothetical protein
VLFGKKEKPHERFYLLPGQGGQNYRRKKQLFMRWSIAAALFFGLLMAGLLWWISRPGR